jgi:hypothetical protein
MRIYYAHCLAIYGTPQEQRDLATLRTLGFVIVNPNNPMIEARCDEYKQAPVDGALRRGRDDGDAVLEDIFKPLVEDADAFAFRALPDGAISNGVARELAWAQAANKPVIELPSGIARRAIGLAETREYLKEVGQR